MDSKITNSQKLPRAPLIFVLALIRFTPVLKMAGCVPDIQDRLRKQGFPKYRHESVQNIMIGSPLPVETISRWVFESSDNQTQVVLTTDALAVQTTSYETFDKFLVDVKNAFQPLADYARPDSIQQIGLRYVDLLTDIDDIGCGDLLQPGLRGVSDGLMGAKTTAFSFVFQSEIPSGMLSVRSLQALGMQGFLPPDLGQVSLTFPDRVGVAQNPRVLDFDHVMQKNLPFEWDHLESQLRELHGYSSSAFRSFVTTEALNAWSKPV